MALSYAVVWYWCPGLYEANTDVGAVAPEYVAPESWFRTGRSDSPPGSYAVPGAIFLLNGIAMLLYQTLDNMDGKQARRTGTSSPLGLLFDHGCDAFNLLLGSANWMAAMAMVPGVSELVGRADPGGVQERSAVSALFGGDTVLAALLMLCPMVTFYVATWEHYHTGKLILPPFNGPSEGLALGATLSFLSFLWGPMCWQGTTLTDGALGRLASLGAADALDFAALQGRVRNTDLVILISVVVLAQEVFLKVLSVVRSHGLNTKRSSGRRGRRSGEQQRKQISAGDMHRYWIVSLFRAAKYVSVDSIRLSISMSLCKVHAHFKNSTVN
jgi:ethanolaminephosphotransferase